MPDLPDLSDSTPSHQPPLLGLFHFVFHFIPILLAATLALAAGGGCGAPGQAARARWEARRQKLLALTPTTPTTQAAPTTGPADVGGGGAGGPLPLAGLSAPRAVESVQAVCVPPMGWKPDPLKSDPRHTHQVWVSPTGKTAYGVIHFNLPLPVGVTLVHWQFLQEMRKHEGEAIDLGEHEDPDLPGLRFECEGGLYHLWANLIVDGFEGWAIYAGTKRKLGVQPAEFRLAERAREATVPGLPTAGEKGKQP